MQVESTKVLTAVRIMLTDKEATKLDHLLNTCGWVDIDHYVFLQDFRLELKKVL